MDMIKDYAYLILFAISVYGWWRGRDKDKATQIEQFVKINLKLDTVCQSQTDIKDDVRQLNKISAETEKKIMVFEEQIKVINHRLDDLERG